MDFSVFKDKLVAEGYSEDTAYAKIAHDIVINPTFHVRMKNLRIS